MAVQHRKLHFDTIADAMAEAERLAAIPVETTGRFSFGQIVDHLGRVFDIAIGHAPRPPMPWFVKLLGRLIRKTAINRPAKPGLKLPSKVQPYFWSEQQVTPEDGMAKLRESYARFVALEEYPVHPLLGKLTKHESHQLQCRHFELHLGFVRPKPM